MKFTKFNIVICSTIIIFLTSIFISAQATSSAVEIITAYSQNENFYLKSVPYDNEFPSLLGKTSVYRKGNPQPLYEIERGFDSVDEESNNLILSNDGEVIFYAIPWDAQEDKEGLQSVTFYKHGKIIKSYTETEITNCDEAKERCRLLYSNYETAVDKDKSNWGTKNYKKTFKPGTTETEKFLSDYPVFSFDDTVYLTDSKKQTHLFNLKDGSLLDSRLFENVFEQIRDKGRFAKTNLQTLNAPIFLDFPNLRNGANVYQKLALTLRMKTAGGYGGKDDVFKIYSFIISGYVLQNGSVEIEKIEADEKLPKDKILAFFKANKFTTKLIPKEFEKWHFDDEYFYLRKADDGLARKERQEQLKQQREELKRNMVAEKINNVYIPKDLGECFIELDKSLKEVDKKEMQSLLKKDEMIKYHMGLGTWMRNNWGLWGGSRLQKYFTDRNIKHPDDMSSVVLYFYYDWLNGKKETWKDWEKNPKSVF